MAGSFPNTLLRVPKELTVHAQRVYQVMGTMLGTREGESHMVPAFRELPVLQGLGTNNCNIISSQRSLCGTHCLHLFIKHQLCTRL